MAGLPGILAACVLVLVMAPVALAQQSGTAPPVASGDYLPLLGEARDGGWIRRQFDEFRAWPQLEEAVRAQAAGNLPAARAAAERMVATQPDDPRGQYLLTVLAQSMGDHAVAAEAAAQVLRLRPGFGPALLYRGLALAGLDRPEEASEALLQASTAQDLSPADRETALEGLVESAVAAGRFDMALQALERSGRGGTHRYQMLLGTILDGRQDFAAAQAAFERAAALAGDEAQRREALRFAAEAARKDGRMAAARALLLDLLESAPDDLAVLRQLAWLDVSAGDIAGGQAWIERILALDADADTRLYLVNLLAEADELEGAIALAERQLSAVTDPAIRHRLLMVLGHLRFRNGDLIAATRAFREAVEILQDPDALIALATVYEQGDRLQEAASLLEAMGERFGLQGVAYRLIQIYERMGDDEAALRVIERAWQEDAAPDFRADLLYRRSLILGRLGDREGEVEALRQAAELQPDNAFFRLALGELEFAAGNYDAAVAAFGTALELEPEPTADTRRRLANAQAAAEQVEAAIGNFELLLPLAAAGSEERAHLLASLANLYARQEAFERSGQAFLDAYGARPGQSPQLLLQAGLSFAQARLWDRAAAALDAAIAAPDADAALRREARERAAVVAEQSDRPADAARYYLQLLDDPDITAPHRLVLLNRLAVVAELARDYAAASRAYGGIVASPAADEQARRTALSRLAVTAELAGDYDTAINAYRRILAAPGLDDEERVDALRRMAIIANVAGRLDVAREAYSILVTGADLPLAARLEAARSLAYIAQVTEEPAGVVEALGDLLRAPQIDDAGRVEVLEGIALTADMAGRPDMVIQAYEQMLPLLPRGSPLRPQVQDNLAAAYERMQRYADAIPLYRAQLDALAPAERQRRVALLQRLAIAAEALGDTEQSREALEQIIALGTDDWQIFERYGLALRAAEDCRGALAMFQRARNLGAGAQSDLYAAFCHADLGEPGLALHYLRQALADPAAEIPGSSRVMLEGGLGFLYAETGQQAQAAAILRQVVTVAPEPETLLALARAERLSGDPEAAATVLSRLEADQLPPTRRPDYFDERAAVERALDRPREALALLDQAIVLDATADRLFSRAILRIELDQAQAGFDDLVAARELAPDNTAIAAALAYAHIDRGEDAAAADLLEPVVRAEPDRLPLYQDLAYLTKRLYRNDQAVTWFERAIDNRPLYPVRDAEEAADLERLMFGLRRENQVLHNDWDASAYAILRSEIAGVPRFDPSGRSSLVAQGGVELAHRPDWITLPDGSPLGFRDGAVVQAFGRMFWGFKRDSLVPDLDSVQAGLGLRWKPLGATNLFLSGERLVPIGKAARHGWLLRASHSWDMGADIKPVEKDWTMAQTYLDAALIPGADGALYLTAEGRLGRSFRLPDRFGAAPVVTPHLLAAGSYSRSSFASERYTELGLGVSGKLWFNQTPYQAYRAVGEVSLQYRAGLDRQSQLSHGPVLTLTIAF